MRFPAVVTTVVIAVAASISVSVVSRRGASAQSPPPNIIFIVERDLVQKALASARNNKSQAAKLLGIPRGQFYSLLRRRGLTDVRR